MEELPVERLAEELQAIMDTLPPSAAVPQDGVEAAAIGDDEAEVESDEDAIRARLRQVRQDSAHIPVAEEAPPGLLGKLKGLLGR